MNRIRFVRSLGLLSGLLAAYASAGWAAPVPAHAPSRPAMVPIVTISNPLGPLSGPYQGPVPRLAAFSEDGRFLAVAGEVTGGKSGGEDCRVGVWDVRSGRRMALLTAERVDFPDQVALSSNGARVALGTHNGMFLWSVKDGRLLARIPGACSALTLTNMGRRLQVLRADGVLVTWENGPIHLRRLHRANRLLMGAFLTDQKRIVGLRGGRSYSRSNADWDVVLVNTATGKVRTLPRVIHNGRMQYFSVAAKTGRAAVFEWWDDQTFVVDPVRGRRLADPQIGGWRNQMALSPNGRRLLLGNSEGDVLLAGSIDGDPRAVAHVGNSHVRALCWSPAGTEVAAIGSNDPQDTGRTIARVWRITR